MRAPQYIIDVTQLCVDPVRTGIQRVVRSLIRDIPSLLDVVCVCFDRQEGAFRTLDGATLNMLIQSAVWDVPSSDVARLVRDRIVGGDLLSVERGAVLLVPEVFYDPQRLAFLTQLRDSLLVSIAMIVFDFAPYFKPGVYRIERGGANYFIPFLRFIAAAQARAFISQPVQDAFCARIARSGAQSFPLDIVTVLGADGLPASDRQSKGERNVILCIGSFDGKKKQELIYAAFLHSRLPEAGFRLRMIGTLPKNLPPQFRPLLSAEARVEITDGLVDIEISRAYDTAAASVFVGV